MDLIDKGIILDFIRNCRVSYQILARRYGITANAIKKRVAKLVKSGVIDRFVVHLNLAMIDAELLVALITTDGSQSEVELTEQIGNNLAVQRIGFLSNGTCILWSEYIGSDGFYKIGRFLRGLDSATEVEVHPLISKRGIKVELTKLQLMVLRCLMEDARMSIAKIASQSGLTARRVRRVLRELQEGKSIGFSIRFNVNVGDSTGFFARISWDERKIDSNDIDEWLRKQFPKEYWYPFVSAVEPTLFAFFTTSHVREIENISKGIKKAPFVKLVKTLIHYPAKMFTPLRILRLKEMIVSAGV